MCLTTLVFESLFQSRVDQSVLFIFTVQWVDKIEQHLPLISLESQMYALHDLGMNSLDSALLSC